MNEKQPKPRLFVSFAVADSELATAVVNFLRLGCNLAEEQVFFTARPEAIPRGRDFGDVIRQSLDNAAMALLLLTPSYYESRFCLAEAGAVWVMQKVHVPMLVPPVDYHDLDGVQLGEQASKIDRSSDWDVLRDLVRGELGGGVGTGLWNEQKEEFLKLWTTKFEGKVAQPKMVPGEEFDAVAVERDAARTDLADLVESRDRLRVLVQELETQNDQLRLQVVDAPEKPQLVEDETTQLLLEAEAAIKLGQERLEPLPEIVKEALFQDFHDSNPLTVGGPADRFTLEEAQKYEERGYLSWIEDEAQMVRPRHQQPQVADAEAALRSLRESVFEAPIYGGTSDAQDWAKQLLKDKFQISDPTFELRPVWESFGFLRPSSR